MNSNQTVEKLRQMRLGAMAELHYQNVKDNRFTAFTPDEYITLLADHEWEDRQGKKMARLIKGALFKQKASVADIDYSHSRNLDRNMFGRLATLSFIKKKENIILTGPSGVGKSYLAQALGNQACLMGYRTVYATTSRILAKLKLSKVDGTYLKELRKLQKTNVLILDDFGLQAFDAAAREILMDIIDDRFNETSTIVSSQIPVSAWYDIIGEGTIADAILDRLVNSSHRIDLKGESLRKGVLKNE
ncbi:putative transposase [Indibacter alkaliphilus LW1]|uniref:Transposase n=1 Tax=Indibacter alkaliphilus (strain CCUG 57479 / KCTC 22604 / LW1) TaxID=1189612 RepID=S2DIG7_INDAL|nr:IS21-like element helper ATPase IstB [Indibacter alkaliphilus]EOZ98802.1 putative transposase [Indibacter alkaliphilus LW1]